MKRFYPIFAPFVTLAMVLSACGGAAAPAAQTQAPVAESVATEPPAAETEAAAPEAVDPGADTGTVFVLGPFRGTEETAFTEVIKVFEEQNPGIDVVYSGTGEFETLISVRVEAGDPPDVAAFPQPGAVAKFAREGQLVPLWNEAVALYDQNYSPAWKELGSVDGTPYGMFHRVNAKGWIWYNKPAFEAAGYTIPTTWEELQTLTQKMAESGTAPWCDGIEASAATGWKGTDWIENLLLRTQPIEVYDQWVTGEHKFNTPEVKSVFETLGQIWMDPKMVYGGPQTVALTNVPQSAAWLFDPEPKCWLHMQGSFVTNFFPENVIADLDNQVGVFMMPPINPDLPSTLEVGGDQYVVFKGKDRPEVRKFVEFLGTVDSAKPWAEQGGALFPHKGQDYTWYPTELERTMAQTVVDAAAARFDGSDSMASKLNLAFWKGITDWVSGNRDLDSALAEIDAAGAE